MADRVVERRINQITLFSAPEFGNLVVGCGGVCHLCVRPFLTVDVVAVVDASTTVTALLCRPYNEKKRRR